MSPLPPLASLALVRLACRGVPVVITSSGQRIGWCDSATAGPTLLAIFGLGSTSGSAPAAWLERLAGSFRLLRLDNRGTGESSDPSMPFSIEDMAADAVAVLDAAGVERAHLYGHSMGGMIAQALARDYPDRVRRVVLEATAPSPAASNANTSTSSDPAARAFHAGFTDDETHDDDDEPAITPENASSFFSMFLAPQVRASAAGTAILEDLADVYAKHRSPTKRTLRWQRRAVLGFDNWSRLGEILAPALVVHPEEDLKPAERSVAFANGLARGALRLVPGAGHDLRWEDPLLSADIVIDFLHAS
jgi:pimeloyl-ACP methyl ester carboxylesterase